MTPRDYVEFSVSALNQPSDSVRRVAERIIIALYHPHPKLVRQYLPLEEDVSPKNVQYRQIFQQFDKIDREVSESSSWRYYHIHRVLPQPFTYLCDMFI